jgi:1-acyl-sn-glycerol-3-phosphate acyltransferase
MEPIIVTRLGFRTCTDEEDPDGDRRAKVGTALVGTGRRLDRLPAAGFPWTAPTWPTGVERLPEKSDLGPDYDTAWARRYPARLARAALLDTVARPAIRALARPEVNGLDRIYHLDTPAVIAPNHASHLDTPLLLTSLPDRIRHKTVVVAGADYFFDKRWKAITWSFTIAAIPIERTRTSRKAIALAVSMLGEGWNVVVYPEGTRSPDGWAAPHKPGAALVAMRGDRPVLPVHLERTALIIPREGGLHPGRTAVTFGRPMSPRKGENVRAFAARIETEVAALADEQATDWWGARRRHASASTPVITGPDGSSWRRSWELTATSENASRASRWPGL